MKNLIVVLSVLFIISFFNQPVLSQNREQSKTKNYRVDMKEQLNLSEDQEKKIEVLKLSQEEKMIKLKSEMELKDLEMRKLKSSDKFSRTEIINLTKDINAIKNEMALAKVNHQMDVYDLLDENQRKIWLDTQEKFGHMKHKMKDRMRERRDW